MPTTKPRTTKQASTEQVDAVAVNNAALETVQKPDQKKREKVRFDDSALIRVKSNTFGTLVYINKRTGDQTVWSHFGEEQVVTMADLRAMKATQNSFFSDNMIIITGCDDDRYEDVEPAEIYDALMVSKYYKNLLDPDKFGTLFSMSDDETRERISLMSQNAKFNLVVALNGAISSGELDSLRKIRLFEEILGCDLADPK